VKLVASAIVHNEADRYLVPWLEHLLSFCDDVILFDDHSTDDTRKIAFGYDGVTVIENTGPRFFANEAEARNRLLEHTYRVNADYVLSIDADEFIGNTDYLRSAIEGDKPVYAVTMREAWMVATTTAKTFGRWPNDLTITDRKIGLRVDGLWGDRRTHMLWKHPGPNVRGSVWKIPNRKLACGREPLQVRRTKPVEAGLAVYHFGWTRVAERQARADRYYEHDGGRFHADKHLQSLLDEDDVVGIDWQPWPVSIPPAVLDLASRP